MHNIIQKSSSFEFVGHRQHQMFLLSAIKKKYCCSGLRPEK